MTAVAKRKPETAEVIPHAASLLEVISSAAADPKIDVVKLEKLMDMYERIDGKRAKAAYLAALAALQPQLPVITKHGVINKNEKDESGKKTGRQEAMTKYAKWEDVVEGITPKLSEYGFSLSFRVAQPTPDRIVVSAVLGHREGHTEETAISLPIDSTGAKNNVQGWGSSVSYGKRYTAFALLNISARGEDDDGKAAGAPETITEEQAAALRTLMEKANIEEQIIFEHFKVAALTELTPAQFETATNKLNKKLVLSS